MKSTFDASQVEKDLRDLPPDLAVALALLAAERLFPALQAYARESGGIEAMRVRAALDEVWRELEARRPDVDMLRALAAEVYELRPETEDNESRISSYALDAAGAAWEAIQAALTHDLSHAVAAMQLAYESVETFAEEREEFHPQASADRAAISDRDVVVRELETQQKQLDRARHLRAEPQRGVRELRAEFGNQSRSNIGLA